MPLAPPVTTAILPRGPSLRDNVVRYNISQDDGLKDHDACIFAWVGGAEMKSTTVYNNTTFNTRGAAVGFAGDPKYAEPAPVFNVDGFKSFDEWVKATGQETAGGRVAGVLGDPHATQGRERLAHGSGQAREAPRVPVAAGVRGDRRGRGPAGAVRVRPREAGLLRRRAAGGTALRYRRA